MNIEHFTVCVCVGVLCSLFPGGLPVYLWSSERTDPGGQCCKAEEGGMSLLFIITGSSRFTCVFI